LVSDIKWAIYIKDLFTRMVISHTTLKREPVSNDDISAKFTQAHPGDAAYEEKGRLMIKYRMRKNWVGSSTVKILVSRPQTEHKASVPCCCLKKANKLLLGE